MRRGAVSVLLWAAAFVVAAALGAFQRMTGPTYPEHGSVMLAGDELRYTLRRTHAGEGGLRVSLDVPESVSGGTLHWRRYPTQDEWHQVPMLRMSEHSLTAEVPHQPPAGKVEYEVVLEADGERAAIPSDGAVVARFRAEVPAGVLIPHILTMFGSMMVATRALFEVLRPGRRPARGLVLTAMGLLVVGGLFLGPVVQKHAFDAYWTGWPFGSDLTDNKTALAVLAWLPATLLALRARPLRAAVVAGWLVMMAVFLIPHSLRGSQLDWTDPAAHQVQTEQT